MTLGSPLQFSFPEEERFDEAAQLNMDVHKRSQIWNQARHK